ETPGGRLFFPPGAQVVGGRLDRTAISEHLGQSDQPWLDAFWLQKSRRLGTARFASHKGARSFQGCDTSFSADWGAAGRRRRLDACSRGRARGRASAGKGTERPWPHTPPRRVRRRASTRMRPHHWEQAHCVLPVEYDFFADYKAIRMHVWSESRERARLAEEGGVLPLDQNITDIAWAVKQYVEDYDQLLGSGVKILHWPGELRKPWQRWHQAVRSPWDEAWWTAHREMRFGHSKKFLFKARPNKEYPKQIFDRSHSAAAAVQNIPDPRAKIPIFPKDPVCRNFYAELLRWPSRYRDYYCCERPADAAIACGKPDWKGCRNHLWDLSSFGEEEVRRLCYSIRDVLEMKGMFYMGRVRRSLRVAFHRKHPGECMPNAPLRALGYTSAGGCFANIRSGKPLSSLMKIGYVPGGNVYSNKIVLMDEAHNLVRSQTQYAEQLQRLRRLLYEAKHLVLAGFTGTPILSEPSEGRQLLDIVKGCLAPEGDEGFLSSFPMRPQPLFPISLPRGLPDGALTLQRKKQLVRKMEMKGEALKVYDLKRRLGLPSRRLRAYCNVSIFHAAFHDGKAGSKARILAYPEDCCPKLLGIAQAVLASEQKAPDPSARIGASRRGSAAGAVIMIGRTSGYVVMLELMKHLASQADPPVGVATMNELSEFNHCSNIRGEIYRVLVADSLQLGLDFKQCSEGVSFLSVRRTFLADVPVAPSGFIQQTGRAIRMYGHRGLPEEEQTVTTQLFVSILPKWMRSSSLACWALRAQKKHSSGKEVEKRARILTARMNRAGISSLEDLKARLDAHGARRQRSRENLSAEDVLTFLEQNGLWEEARLLRSADKKDKEKAQAAEETQALQNGASRESLRGESTELLKGGTLEEDEFANALANMLEEELPEEERQQEMEALKEEQDADDVDGEAKPSPPAPSASQAVATLAMSPEQAAMSPGRNEPGPGLWAQVAQCLTETLQALRAALREAEKKPEKDASLPAASSVAVAGAAEPSASAPEAAASVPLAAAAVTAGAESEMREYGAKDGDEPMPPEREAHAPNTETPQAATQPQEAEASQPAPAPEATSAVQPTQLTPEERKARRGAALAWEVDKGIRRQHPPTFKSQGIMYLYSM
ncbi:unnamed protein product, partial [Effrenium voratum]